LLLLCLLYLKGLCLLRGREQRQRQRQSAQNALQLNLPPPQFFAQGPYPPELRGDRGALQL
jgi:hypothetical protein